LNFGLEIVYFELNLVHMRSFSLIIAILRNAQFVILNVPLLVVDEVFVLSNEVLEPHFETECFVFEVKQKSAGFIQHQETLDLNSNRIYALDF